MEGCVWNKQGRDRVGVGLLTLSCHTACLAPDSSRKMGGRQDEGGGRAGRELASDI